MALFEKLPFCLVTLFVVVTFGDQEVDNWQAPYHYWSPDGNNQLANHDYRRQYATTPNLMNHLGSPGVAACLFLSSAGSLANFAYTTLKCEALSARISSNANSITAQATRIATLESSSTTSAATDAANAAKIKANCEKINAVVDVGTPLGAQTLVDTTNTGGDSATKASVETAINNLQTRLDAITALMAVTC